MISDIITDYSKDKDVKCVFCKWKGKLSEANKHYVCSEPEAWWSLAGREGYEWDCPKCGVMVHSEYSRMS